MPNIFLTILNISITASYIALAAIILRLLLKRNPKWITCILWALVAIRLLVPFSFESKLSLIPSAEPVKSQAVLSSADTPKEDNYDALKPQTPDTKQEAPDSPQAPVIEQENPENEKNPLSPVLPITPDNSEDTPAESITPSTPQISLTEERGEENAFAKIFPILSYVWAGGVICMLTYSVISFVRLKRKVRASIPTDKGIYICDDISTPFILGVIKPRIYLPSTLMGEELQYITSHEKAHLKRLDHLWKPLGFVLLSVHWFNPLMWISYILLCRDIELACDEKVLRDLGTDSKKHYSRTLLTFSTERKLVSACPLAFGEVGVKQRIKNIVNYKKPAFWVTLLSLLLCLAIGLCFLTNPVSDKENNNTTTTETTDTDTDEINILSKDHSYYLKATELIYDNPIYNYIQNAEEAPTYRLVNCSQLHEIAHSSNGYNTKLIADTSVSELYGSFDSTFSFGNDGFSEGYSIEFLRENNLSTIWAENDTYYYQILKQKDNTHYLVVGHIADPDAPTPDEELYSDYTIITPKSDRYVRWIYKVNIKEAKGASLMLPEPKTEDGYIDYTYQDEDALRSPNIRLYPESKTFEFFIHSLSSLLPTGTYETGNSKLILKTEGVSNQTYVFNIIDSENLEFSESESSPIPTFKPSASEPAKVPFDDGAIFIKCKEYTTIPQSDTTSFTTNLGTHSVLFSSKKATGYISGNEKLLDTKACIDAPERIYDLLKDKPLMKIPDGLIVPDPKNKIFYFSIHDYDENDKYFSVSALIYENDLLKLYKDTSNNGVLYKCNGISDKAKELYSQFIKETEPYYTIKSHDFNYTYEIKKSDGTIIESKTTTRQPHITHYPEDNLISVMIQSGTGSLARSTVFYNTETGEISTGFIGIVDYKNGLVVSSGSGEVTITNLQKPELKQVINEFEKPVSTFIENIRDVEFTEDFTKVKVVYSSGEYQNGEEVIKVTEHFDINKELLLPES